jgi:hypothetical protein
MTLPPGGVFTEKKVGEKSSYWYYRLRFQGRDIKRYLGKDSPELRQWMAKEADGNIFNKKCADLTRIFLNSGFPKPARQMGQVLEALSEAGFFRLRGVLIGSLAFQCYSAMLGRTPGSRQSAMTHDVYLAQSRQVSIAVDDAMFPSFYEALQKAGQFEPVPGLKPGSVIPSWRDSKTGCAVDLLTPKSGKEAGSFFLPSTGEDACGLRFLDFLIDKECRAAVLHKSGISVHVPDPARFAVHKLIISQERGVTDKIKKIKDIQQSRFLCECLLEDDRRGLETVLNEAYARGPGWRRRLREGILSLPDDLPQKINELLPVSSLALGVSVN